MAIVIFILIFWDSLLFHLESKSAWRYLYKRWVLEVLSNKGLLLPAVGLFICMVLFVLKHS